MSTISVFKETENILTLLSVCTSKKFYNVKVECLKYRNISSGH